MAPVIKLIFLSSLLVLGNSTKPLENKQNSSIRFALVEARVWKTDPYLFWSDELIQNTCHETLNKR